MDYYRDLEVYTDAHLRKHYNIMLRQIAVSSQAVFNVAHLTFNKDTSSPDVGWNQEQIPFRHLYIQPLGAAVAPAAIPSETAFDS